MYKYQINMATQNRAAIAWTMPRCSAQPQITSEEEDSAGMSLYTVVRHPRVHARRRHRPPQVEDLAIRHIIEHMGECRPRPAAGQAS